MLDLKSTHQRSAHATRMTSFCSFLHSPNRSNLTLLVSGSRSIAFWLYQSCFQFDLRDVDLCTSITLPIENHDCVPFILELLSKSLWCISLLQLMKRRVAIEFDIYCWCFHKRLLPGKLGPRRPFSRTGSNNNTTYLMLLGSSVSCIMQRYNHFKGETLPSTLLPQRWNYQSHSVHSVWS